MPTVNGHTVETGCYVDGHWGQYGPSRVLSIADDLLGTNYCLAALAEGAETGIMTDELSADDAVLDLADEAEAALNNATDDGHAWGWYDGEFFLWTVEDWEEETY